MKKIILAMTTVFAMLLIMAFTCYGKQIKACYQKNNGQLRYVLDFSECRPPELQLSWDDNGPGPKGDKGDTGPQGPPGKDGRGIVSVSFNEANGTLTLNFTDGTSFTTPSLIGPAGKDGRGIVSVSFNEANGTLTLNFTDGSSYTTPRLIPDVPKICAGTICYDDVTRCNGSHIVSSCATVGSNATGYYQIAFNFDQPPICVIYTYPNSSSALLLIWTQILSSLPTGMVVNTYTRGDGPEDVDADFNFICTQP